MCYKIPTGTFKWCKYIFACSVIIVIISFFFHGSLCFPKLLCLPSVHSLAGFLFFIFYSRLFMCYKLMCSGVWATQVLKSVWIICSATKLFMSIVFNPLHPNISMHILLTVLFIFLKVPKRRIWFTIKRFSSWWSFPLFSWH